MEPPTRRNYLHSTVVDHEGVLELLEEGTEQPERSGYRLLR
jgi:hypothetical protein